MILIGIDGNEANIEKRVGVGRYAYELLKQFAKYQVSSSKYQVYLKEKPLSDLPKEADWWKYKIVGPKKFWTQIGLPWALLTARPKPDVFFTPSHYAPRFCPSPRVISLMDLAFLYFPEMFKKGDLWQLKNWTAYSVKKAAKILTISKSSKDDIIKYYQVPMDKIAVTYPGFEMKTLTRNSQSATIKQKYGIKDDYLLSVGTIQPRKNYPRLIEAFATLKNLDLELVIVGKPGWLDEKVYQAPKKHGVGERVKFLNYVPDEDLAALYKAASCFVLVSLYEGFGLPALEAMTYGCPVVVSNISSLPEVVGEAGILVDPYNVEEIAAGIEAAMRRRSELIEKGLKQRRQFSWENCAKETLAVLEDVAKNH